MATSVSAQTNSNALQIPVDSSFTDWGIRWPSGERYTALIAIVELNDRIALCGTGYLNNNGLKRINQKSLRAKSLVINKRTVLEDFSFFTKTNSKKSMKTSNATCQLTSAKMNQMGKNSSIDIKSSKKTFRD
jgi:hypothetical protein